MAWLLRVHLGKVRVRLRRTMRHSSTISKMKSRIREYCVKWRYIRPLQCGLETFESTKSSPVPSQTIKQIFNMLPSTTIITLLSLASISLAITPSNATVKACNTTYVPNPPYPTRCQIGQIFDTLQAGNFTTFLKHLSPTVHWTLMGTHPLAGLYTNKTIFAEDALQRLSSTLDPNKGSTLEVVNLVGGGEDEWCTVELHATAIAKNGEHCFLLVPLSQRR